MNVDELIARQEIRDALSRYCRGIDRMDREMAYAVWHEGATANYLGMYEGSGRGFIDWAFELHERMQCHSHQVSNVLAEVMGEEAASESYVTAALWTQPTADGHQSEIVVRGRYLDRWSRREDRWAIDHRTFVADTWTVREIEAGPVSEQSARDESDPSFRFIPKA